MRPCDRPTIARLLLFVGPRLGPIALALFVLVPRLVLARGGGGEHYTGDRGNGGGDGGGIPIELLWLLIRLTIDHPLVMIPVWIGIVLFLRYARKQTPGARTQAGMRELDRSRLRSDDTLDAGVAELRARDPEFNPDAFMQRTGVAFVEIQEAWFVRRLERARRLMSDGLHRRFATLLTLMDAEGRRDAIADIRVLRTRLLRLEHSETFDLATVRIDASMRDVDVAKDVSDEKARATAQRAAAEEFSEVWTFVRSPGAKTKPELNLGQGACPNCGAPFTGGAAGKCEYCGAIVNSGHYDWVLSEITQASEYLPHSHSDVAQPLLERDPDAAPEILEDRALLLFWKWLEAWALAKPEGLRKLSTPGAYEELQREMAQRKLNGRGALLRLPAVGGADLLTVEVDHDGLDLAHIDVRWSAAGLDAGSVPRPRRHVLTMVRATGATTSPGVGLATERCGNCEAPLTNSDSVTCDFCGHDLSSAEKEWQLADVRPYEAWQRPARGAARAPDRLPVFATEGERMRLLQLLAVIAHADGVVDRSEEKLLRSYASRWQIPWSRVAPLLTEAAPSDLAPPTAERAGDVLATLVRAARIDGRVDRRERAVLERAAVHLKVPPGTLERLLEAHS